MSINELYTKPGHLIRRANQIIVGMFVEECSNFDITPVQYACLVAIQENPDGVDATRISHLIAFDRSTLGQVLDRLEAKKLITRTGSPDDRRMKLAKVTKQGTRLLEVVEPAVQRAMDRFLGRLPSSDQRAFIRIMTRLVEVNNEFSRAPLRVVADKGVL
ncbi:MarR family winged helix-turn-helix transcriptional regulator [Tardiphaga robiniae]|uniref:MarR family transcriptional regulator n=1 Tax=Tardiphaga robiniae TaxID=943830 RepID=A0A7G6U1K6_9BRAD|nr:MarR family transcriptional regulator [Tardiphaga robiniae]QND72888.1 MarR family transcriptional regulator [Tardiphaga robiniae]